MLQKVVKNLQKSLKNSFFFLNYIFCSLRAEKQFDNEEIKENERKRRKKIQI